MSQFVLSQSWTSRTGFALPINSVLNYDLTNCHSIWAVHLLAVKEQASLLNRKKHTLVLRVTLPHMVTPLIAPWHYLSRWVTGKDRNNCLVHFFYSTPLLSCVLPNVTACMAWLLC